MMQYLLAILVLCTIELTCAILAHVSERKEVTK